MLLAGEVLHPDRSTYPVRQVAIVSNDEGAWYLSNLLLFIGVVLTVPVILRLMHALNDRSPRLAFVGGSLAGLGAICFAGLLTVGFVVWQMAAPGADLCLIGFVSASAYAVAVSIVFACGLVPLGLASLGIQTRKRASRRVQTAQARRSDAITGSR